MAAPFQLSKTLRLLSALRLPQTTPVRLKSRGLVPRRRKPIQKWFDPADKSWAEPIVKHHEQKQAQPEQEASMLHMVYRIKDHYTRPYWEKDILKEFGLFEKTYNPVVLKNTPDVNEKLRTVQHLIRIKPVTFPYGLPKDESDYKHCFLNENGEFVVKHRIKDNSAESEQAWSEVKMVEERLQEDAIWKMDKDTIQKEARQIIERFKVSEEYFQEKYVYKYNQDGKEYRYTGENKINSHR
ncbi:hypothetical protein EGW08_013419, partial [Elysia chlorotica]